jgi:hypothetical protein
MQVTILRIHTNDNSSVNSAQQTVDAKVVELLAKLATKPLLLDKLSISKDSGLTLDISSKQNNISLKLPLSAANQLKSITSSNNLAQVSVQVSLNTQKQFVVTLSPTQSTTNSSNPTDTQNLRQQEPVLAKLVFSQSKLIKNSFLELSRPILASTVATSTTSAGNNQYINSTPPMLAFTQGVKSQSTLMINNHSLLDQKGQSSELHTIASERSFNNSGKLTQISLNQLNNSQNTAVKILNEQSAKSPITAQQAIKDILSHSFPKSSNLASIISSVQNRVQSYQAVITKNLVQDGATKLGPLTPQAKQIIGQSNSIIHQVNQLIASINKPKLEGNVELSNRINHSGNLLENKLSQLNHLARSENNTSVDRLVNSNQSNNTKRTDQANTSSSSPTGAKSNQSGQLLANDVKLQLVHIKANLEKLIGRLNNLLPSTLANPSNTTSTKPASLNSSMLTVNQPLNNASLAGPQVSAELLAKSPETSTLRATNNPALIGHNSNRHGVANAANKNSLTSPSLLIQMNKLVTDIATEVRSALSQIETNQLLSLRTEQPNLHQFLVDLPIANAGKIDSFELLFENRQKQQNKAKKQWKVVVRFDLDPLGPMFAQVELKDNRISTDIFAETQSTAQLINQHLHILQKSLFEAGIDIDKIASSQGNIPEKLLKNNDHTVDIRV